MGDISKGRTYSGGNIVVADGVDEGVNKIALNKLADEATVNPSFIYSKTEDNSPDPAADYVVTYDASADALKKVLLNKLPGAGVIPTPGFVVIATGATPTFACNSNKVSQNFAFILPNASDATLSITGVSDGMQGILLVQEGNTTLHDLYLPAGSYIPGNAAAGTGPADLQKVLNRITACLWIYNGTNYFWSFIKY